MKKSSFLDFLIKNRYSCAGVAVVLIIAFLGWIPKLIELAAILGLIFLAIYIGKRIQEDESYIGRTIEKQINNKKNEDKDNE